MKTSNPTPRRVSQNALWLSLAAAGTFTVHGTDGYFANGYGAKAKGRAGVAIAETDDAFGGANNPATIAWGDNRFDIGLEWFRPQREVSRLSPAPGWTGGVTSERDNFFIPEIAYKHALGTDLAFGVSIYGNGGMNTDYPTNPATGKNVLGGSGHLGVNLSQLLVAPTLAWKFAPNQSLGLAPIIGYQRFKAYGLDGFGWLSNDPLALTDRGVDEAWGIGARVGYLWNIRPEIAFGIDYSSPVFSQGFGKYRGLFAGNGSFDIPQSAGAGFTWQALSKLKLGLDYKYIDYAGIDPVGLPSSQPGKLGLSNGPGFGWKSISVVKVGADWKVADQWTLRAGYSFNENPIGPNDVTFNILAPGVVQHHLTAGLTFEFGKHELTAAYAHAFQNSVTGPSLFGALNPALAGTTEEITMSQDSVTLAYGFKF